MISELRIYDEGRWARKHLASLMSAYARAPYLSDHLNFVGGLFSGKFDMLIDFNRAVIRYLMDHFQIKTKTLLLSELGIEGKGDQRLIELCKKMEASHFLAQSAAKKYLDTDLFREAGIELEFFNPPSPVYPQLWGDFLPNLSAFDLLFNCGPKAHDILVAC